jgi:2-hydroxychromene-2-carboxylate isomerase
MLDVTHYSDPGCPWAYSAWPALTTLQWRYGDQLRWRLVLIGLAETPERYLKNGYTPQRQATGYIRFRRYGMPFATAPRERVVATGRACRAVVAARLQDPALEIPAFRALQWAQFTTTLLFDTDEGIRDALREVPGLDAGAVVAALDSDEVTAAYEEDRALARTAQDSPTEFQGKAAQTDGPVRFTAPSLQVSTNGGAPVRTLEAGGFQTIEAYDVCIANLDPTLDRRPPADDVTELLAAFGHPLTTAEVSAAMQHPLTPQDRTAAEAALVAAVAEGRVTRLPLGDDALWQLN